MDPPVERAPLTHGAADRLRDALPAAFGLAVFALALLVLRRQLHAVSLHEIARDVLSTPTHGLLLALALTAVNYAVVTGYDFLAFAYVGKHLPRQRIVLASFLAYAIANNVGFATLSGASIRYRFYTRWGMTTAEVSRIVFAYATTFWLGLLLLGGHQSTAFTPLPDAIGVPRRVALSAGIALARLMPVAYLVLTAVRRAPLHDPRIRYFHSPGRRLRRPGEWKIESADRERSAPAVARGTPPA